MTTLGSVDVLNPESTPDPFDAEKALLGQDFSTYKLAHFYGGTFPNLVQKLKDSGVKVTYTVAAHDVDVSRSEFQCLKMNFNFPHLNNKDLFERYISSYKKSDLVICPSKIAQEINNRYRIQKTTIIPHGHGLS